VVKLARERKHLTDIIKMVANQADSDPLALRRPHFARVARFARETAVGSRRIPGV
jgi:hypothetical protein